MKKLRRYLLLGAFLTLCLPQLHIQAAEDVHLNDEMINGRSAILIDGTTGTVLYAKNPDDRHFPASITKIATGIYAIENGNPSDIVTVSKKAREVEGTRVYLAEGEKVPLEKLEYGLLMNSGNDAAIAIAEHMEGSTENFGEKLTAYIKEKTGVQHTNFTNPHGLHDDNHYTTAADMAKIAQYAMKNPTFRKIVGTKRLKWDGAEWKTVIVNHNKMLTNYEGATGIKNGFTDQAHSTLVASAKRGNTELIAVTMMADTSAATYKDVTTMLDYGFAHYETKQVSAKGDAFANKDLYLTVPIGATIHRQMKGTSMLEVQVSTGEEYYFSREPSQQELLVAQAERQKEKEQAAQLTAKAANTLPHILLFFAWLFLNVFMLAYTVRRTMRKRKAAYQQTMRRRADW
ncbi:D-alanyl-D-alanine carboxypeptidase [Brevibacillus fluminis]|uniref:D-alanyl-D-alanine carboxypeptidase n=1 Tax=Brevibacillus fluminis TaxID=511487 RepID=A0A3M8CY63_9BACL|nr:D-alanyl-D-alanine carboxypeptidase family protein [Brevibacillus fluminis]RNB80187.1 D-alanyl-D-alanine carboxypeptidase [Brevibacillus fluminis]